MSKFACVTTLLLLSFSTFAAQPIWDKWYLDNGYEKHRDWLVVADQPGNCYMLQQYAIAPDLIIRADNTINLNGAGRYDSITYQVDIGNKFTRHNPGTTKPGYVVLPDASVRMLKLSSTLNVVVDYGGSGDTKQSYSLMGFTKAHEAMARCNKH